jgi:hypothetical protein
VFGNLQGQHYLELSEESVGKGGVIAMGPKLGNDLPLAEDVLLPHQNAPLAFSQVLLQDVAIHA